MKMNLALQVSIIILGVTVVGCGHKKTAAGASHPPQMVEAQVVTSGNQQKILTELTEASYRFWAMKGQRPRTLEEVVAAGYLKSIPAPPVGKQFVIDPKTVHVLLVDQ